MQATSSITWRSVHAVEIASVMLLKKKTNRVFSQAKSHDLFYIWVTKLQAHRSFKRNEATQASSLLQTLPHCTAVGLAQRNGDLVINRWITHLKPLQNPGKSLRVKASELTPVSFCTRTLHGCWNQLWRQEGCLQPTPQWIKKCLPGCSKVTTQTTALKVVFNKLFMKYSIGFGIGKMIHDKGLSVCFLNHWSNKHVPCLPPELNRCHLDLSELNRLIQGLQALELGQAFNNGDLKRIISTQVGFSWLNSLSKSFICSYQHCMQITHVDTATTVCPESFTGETEKAKVCENVGPLSHAFQSWGPGNGKNGPWRPISLLILNHFNFHQFVSIVFFYTRWILLKIFLFVLYLLNYKYLAF